MNTTHILLAVLIVWLTPCVAVALLLLVHLTAERFRARKAKPELAEEHEGETRH